MKNETTLVCSEKRQLPLSTDSGNAELFTSLYRDQIRFDHPRQSWLLYGKHWWTADMDGELIRMAKQVIRFRLKTSVQIEDDDERQNEIMWALMARSDAG